MLTAISVTFLGTGGSVPNKFRNLPSVLIRRGPEVVLFDCGEGTQRQFLQAKAGVNRRMRIFISHLHGDHVFGLPGLIHSLSFMGRQRELEIVGPKGVAKLVTSVNSVVKLYSNFPNSDSRSQTWGHDQRSRVQRSCYVSEAFYPMPSVCI